ITAASSMSAIRRRRPPHRGQASTSNPKERFSYCTSRSGTDCWCFVGGTGGDWGGRLRGPVEPFAVVVTDTRLEPSVHAALADRGAADTGARGHPFARQHAGGG